ncbi:unnamed protein product, partial [Pylaiella littoralis]
ETRRTAPKTRSTKQSLKNYLHQTYQFFLNIRLDIDDGERNRWDDILDEQLSKCRPVEARTTGSFAQETTSSSSSSSSLSPATLVWQRGNSNDDDDNYDYIDIGRSSLAITTTRDE